MGIIPIEEEPSYPLTRAKPIGTYGLIIANIIVYIVTSGSNMLVSTSDYWIKNFAVTPLLLVDPGQFYRLLTSMFLHADFFHILFNMYFLYMFGKEVEKALGTPKYLILYFISGLMASAFHIGYTPIMGPLNLVIPALGASGAISGVLGAYLLLFPRRRMTICWFMWFIPWCFTTTAASFLIFWFALQIIYGYARLGSIAFFAHAGGFVAGLALIGLLRKPFSSHYRRFYPYQVIPYTYAYTKPSYTAYPVYPRWYTSYSEEGIDKGTRNILAILLLLLAIGSLYSIAYGWRISEDMYIYDIKASYKGASIVEDLAVYDSLTNKVVYYPAEDAPRIILNRLYWSGVIKGPPNQVKEGTIFDGIAKTSIANIAIYIKISGRIEYDSKGVMVSSKGEMLTDVLQITATRVYKIRNIEFTYEIHSIENARKAGRLIVVPSAILSLIAIALAFYSINVYTIKQQYI